LGQVAAGLPLCCGKKPGRGLAALAWNRTKPSAFGRRYEPGPPPHCPAAGDMHLNTVCPSDNPPTCLFLTLPPGRFKSYSKYPPCYKDVAFWVSDAFTENNLCVGGGKPVLISAATASRLPGQNGTVRDVRLLPVTHAPVFTTAVLVLGSCGSQCFLQCLLARLPATAPARTSPLSPTVCLQLRGGPRHRW